MAGDTHPHALPLLRARITGPSVSAINADPAKSMDLERFSSLDSDTVFHVRNMHTVAIAAPTQNRPCQPVTSTRTPPSNGPAAAPTAAAAPHSDTARSCSCPLLATDNRLRPQARIVAPAAPWTNRPAMTAPPDEDRPMKTHDTTKSSRPSWKIRLRPKTSPSEPDVTMTAAPTSE